MQIDITRMSFSQVQALKTLNKYKTLPSKRELTIHSGVSYDTVNRLINRGFADVDSSTGHNRGHGTVYITENGIKAINKINNKV